ncbi:MAG: hypothetical protein JWO77_514 [Ilumatobacteraceae bacterium]|nr:hypothetical protein [Ilumatobacteraceae bacterium]
MNARTRRPAIAALVAAAGLLGSLAVAVPAGAEEPDVPYFAETRGAAVDAPDGAQPVVGHFTDQVLDDVLWYQQGTGKESLWTPCPGCESGPFTKKQLPAALQVTGYYHAFVGDFAGNGLDDIYWVNQDGGDYLWTSTGVGGFTSKRFDGPTGEWWPTLLPDSRSGDGKDDLLWVGGWNEPGRLWVFPDDGGGVARTRSRPKIPVGQAVVGDFDGNGAADILFYPHITPCRCPTPSAASTIDTLWRRAGSEAAGFTATTMNIKGEYAPVVGRFSAEGDPRDDILWVGQYFICCQAPEDRPDSLWEGRANGGFTASTQSFPSASGGVVAGHDGADTAIIFAGNGVSNAWFDTTSGPVVRPIGSQLPGWSWEAGFVGRFISADRADLFIEEYDSEPDTLYHPIF